MNANWDAGFTSLSVGRGDSIYFANPKTKLCLGAGDCIESFRELRVAQPAPSTTLEYSALGLGLLFTLSAVFVLRRRQKSRAKAEREKKYPPCPWCGYPLPETPLYTTGWNVCVETCDGCNNNVAWNTAALEYKRYHKEKQA